MRIDLFFGRLELWNLSRWPPLADLRIEKMAEGWDMHCEQGCIVDIADSTSTEAVPRLVMHHIGHALDTCPRVRLHM